MIRNWSPCSKAHLRPSMGRDFLCPVIDTVSNFVDRLVCKSGTEPHGSWIITALLPLAESLRNFSIHLIHTRPEVLKPVPFPGIPCPSDLDLLDRQPRSNPKSPSMKEDVRDLQELFVNREESTYG
ncbi:hypothetical protein EDD16DRAFT_1008950 [Pisolithus croceorrhizus]|nr:hypothetical protein EDD16DRAFT_1008950 [Pisolithus croceorrhizus]